MNAVVNQIFSKLEKVLLGSHNMTVEGCEREELLQIIQKFKIDENFDCGIDYDRYWIAFNELYFLKNLYKSLVAVDFSKQKFSLNKQEYKLVVDVGSGSGVFTIAWRSLLDGRDCQYLLVDKNLNQLSLAKLQFFKLAYNNTSFSHSIFPSANIPSKCFRLFSYWFCEQHLLPELFEHYSDIDIFGEGALIVDYKHTIQKVCKFTTTKYSYETWTVPLKGSPQHILGHDKELSYVHGAYIYPR